MAIHIEALTEFPEVPEWAEAWAALLERAGNDEVFCTYEWAKACAEFDRDGQPLILAGYDQERLIGLAPFTRRRVRRGLATSWSLEFLALPWADYCDVIAEPAWRAEFLEQCLVYLEQDAPPWDEVRLTNLAEGSSTANLFSELGRVRGWQADLRATNIGPVLDLAQADSTALDELLEKKGVARKAKTLARKGRLEFKVVREQAEVRPLLRDFYRFHTVRYLLCGQPSLYDPEDDNSLCRLFDLLTENLSPVGKVCVPTLFFDGQPMALYFGFEHRDCMTLYATTFDSGVIGTSPGEILAWEVARYCRTSGIRKLDFGIGDESYKFRFTNTLRRNCELIIHRHALQAPASSALTQVRTWAKSRPTLWNILRQAKDFYGVTRMEARRAGVPRAALSLLTETWRQLERPAKSRLRRYLNSTALPQERKLISDETPLLLPQAKLLELHARDFVTTVLAYRQALPSWYFKRALEYLRQGRRGFLVMEDECLRQIVWVNGQSDAAGQLSWPSLIELGISEIWPVKNHVPAQRTPHFQTDSLPGDPSVSEKRAI